MHLEGYNLRVAPDGLTYFFDNVGDSGEFLMGVQYTPLENRPNTFNLGYGALFQEMIDDELKWFIDDKIVTDNGNRDEVLGTVVHTLFLFWADYPGKSVYITGSNPMRTRLYRGVINIHGHQLDGYAIIHGATDKLPIEFEPGKDYEGFIIEPINDYEHETVSI